MFLAWGWQWAARKIKEAQQAGHQSTLSTWGLYLPLGGNGRATWYKKTSNISKMSAWSCFLDDWLLVAQLSQHFAAAISRRPARAGAVLRILCMRKQESFPQLQTLGFHAKLQGIAVLVPLQGWRTCQPSLWRSWPAHESHDNLDNLDIRAWNYVKGQGAEPPGPTRQVQWDFRPLSVECSKSPLSCAWRTWAPPLHPQVTSFMISILIILTQADWCAERSLILGHTNDPQNLGHS